jgi:hypothetical protein
VPSEKWKKEQIYWYPTPYFETKQETITETYTKQHLNGKWPVLANISFPKYNDLNTFDTSWTIHNSKQFCLAVWLTDKTWILPWLPVLRFLFWSGSHQSYYTTTHSEGRYKIFDGWQIPCEPQRGKINH